MPSLSLQLKGFHLTHTVQISPSLSHPQATTVRGFLQTSFAQGDLANVPWLQAATLSPPETQHPHVDSVADPQQLPHLPPQCGSPGTAILSPKSYPSTVPTPGDEGCPLPLHASSFTISLLLPSPASLLKDARPPFLCLHAVPGLPKPDLSLWSSFRLQTLTHFLP